MASSVLHRLNPQQAALSHPSTMEVPDDSNPYSLASSTVSSEGDILDTLAVPVEEQTRPDTPGKLILNDAQFDENTNEHETASPDLSSPVDATLSLASELSVELEKNSTSGEDSRKGDTIMRHPLDNSSPEKEEVLPAAASSSGDSTLSDLSSAGGRKRKNMRVSFRSEEDSELVSDYVLPPDPWRFADESSMQSVLKAYAQLCLHSNVQPLPKVLESIKRNPGGRQRSGVFDLSGETIDLALVDTLEAIFMRMCFEELNLDGCLSDDELAVALMDMLEYYQMADKLVVSNNKKLQFRGWLAIAKNLKNCPLYYFDARGCILHDQFASLISRALRCGTNLVTLHLENCNLSGRPAFLLVSALQFSETIQELFLGDNKLTPNDMIHLASALKHGWRVRVLDLRNNPILNSGAAHLLDSIEDSSLRALVLYNTGISSQIGKILAKTLTRSRTLETLNVGCNDLTDETIFAIKEALMINRSIRRLGLQNAKISDEGCIALAEFLADHSRFLRLDIRHNDIKGAGWLALSHAAKLCPSLVRVDMSYDFRELKHTETIRDSVQLIQTTCLDNMDRFEKSLLPQIEEETVQEDKEITANGTDSPAEPETNGESSTTGITVTAPDEPEVFDDLLNRGIIADDIESPASDYPAFIGDSFNGNDGCDEDEDGVVEPAIDIDIPRKKCHPGRRRSSITSVTATGPLSVCDRLNEELFPVRPAPILSVPPIGLPVVKGRFQISLVKATEKIYQSVQSVLSPTSSQAGTPIGGANGDAVDGQRGQLAPSVPDGKGLFNWRATFRRGSKEISQVDLPALSETSDRANATDSTPLKTTT